MGFLYVVGRFVEILAVKGIITLAILILAHVLHAQTKQGLDPSFGNHGIVLDSNAGAGALVIQPDGKIVDAGGAVYRFLPNGTYDSTFGVNGKGDRLPPFPDGHLVNLEEQVPSSYCQMENSF